MTTITLTILRGPESAALEQRTAQGGELTLGRGAECDWRLGADKEISKKHCRFEFSASGWQLRDLSSNGTFVNWTPVGPEQAKILVHGDRLQVGSYEIEVSIAAESDGVRPMEGWRPAAPPGPGDPFPPAEDNYTPIDIPAGPTGEAFPGFNNPPNIAVKIPPHWSYGETDPAPLPAVPWQEEQSPNPKDPIPGQESQPALEAASARDGSTTFAVFAAGLNLPPGMVARANIDSEAALRNAGALLRAAVNAIRALLMARGDVKGAFRIEQTKLKIANNNPLKFSPSDDDALATLLDPRTNSLRAMKEAVDDLTLHQVATLAAMQTAARALLQGLAPAHIEAEDAGGGLWPGLLREQRLWEAYRKRHAQLLEQFEDNFNSAFGKAFARAYEDAENRSRD